MTTRTKRCILVIAAALGLTLAVACARRESVPGTPPYLTIILLDGLSQEIFQRELAAGNLPHLAQAITEGSYIENGIGAIPSMTGYAFFPFLTGNDAPRSGLLGLRWFDRERERGNFRNYVGRTNRLMNRDLGESSTLFELARGEYTSSWNSYLTRGATREWKTPWRFTLAKYREHGIAHAVASIPWLGNLLIPDWSACEENLLGLALRELERRPKIQWITFASLDGYQHLHGSDEGYVDLLRRADSWIERYRARCRELGQERILAIVSDHGVEDVSRHVDLREHFRREWGLELNWDRATHLEGSDLKEPLARHADEDGFVAVNGNLMSWVYLRDPRAEGIEGFRHRLPPDLLRAYPTKQGHAVDLITALPRLPGIEFAAGLDSGGTVVVASAKGEGRIRRDGDQFAYQFSGDDPLGYFGDSLVAPLLDQRFHAPDEWLFATAHTRYPYAVPRLYSVITAPDAGDLFVTSAPDFDLGLDFELVVKSYAGGHGGIRGTQTRVPYILVGPGIARGVRIDAARSEDLGSLFISLLCPGIMPAHDGRIPPGALQ
ncbi:MAG: alkaline phosphatase family protein [Candidatus Eisenbacteria bacterium]